jgi:hypothetical protein
VRSTGKTRLERAFNLRGVSIDVPLQGRSELKKVHVTARWVFPSGAKCLMLKCFAQPVKGGQYIKLAEALPATEPIHKSRPGKKLPRKAPSLGSCVCIGVHALAILVGQPLSAPPDGATYWISYHESVPNHTRRPCPTFFGK